MEGRGGFEPEANRNSEANRNPSTLDKHLFALVRNKAITGKFLPLAHVHLEVKFAIWLHAISTRGSPIISSMDFLISYFAMICYGNQWHRKFPMRMFDCYNSVDMNNPGLRFSSVQKSILKALVSVFILQIQRSDWSDVSLIYIFFSMKSRCFGAHNLWLHWTCAIRGAIQVFSHGYFYLCKCITR